MSDVFLKRIFFVQLALALVIFGISLISTQVYFIISFLCGAILGDVSFLIVRIGVNHLLDKHFYETQAKRSALFSYGVRIVIYAILIYISFKLFPLTPLTFIGFVLGIESVRISTYIWELVKGGE